MPGPGDSSQFLVGFAAGLVPSFVAFVVWCVCEHLRRRRVIAGMRSALNRVNACNEQLRRRNEIVERCVRELDDLRRGGEPES